MISQPHNEDSPLTAYTSQVSEDDLISGFKNQTPESLQFFSSLSEEQLQLRYAEGKWNIKEILLHIIDTERVFAFRALSFARGDKAELPGFDHDKYVENSHANERDVRSLLEEYAVVRTATVALFSGLSESVLDNTGIASGKKISVRELGFAILGHERHHLRIIRERYLEI